MLSAIICGYEYPPPWQWPVRHYVNDGIAPAPGKHDDSPVFNKLSLHPC